eukprot:6240243-Lingulodinium_polyedra.AAC.1
MATGNCRKPGRPRRRRAVRAAGPPGPGGDAGSPWVAEPALVQRRAGLLATGAQTDARPAGNRCRCAP